MYKWFSEHFWELNQKLINLPFSSALFYQGELRQVGTSN